MNDKKIIAEIRLAPGEIGYYDEYSRIYLTNTNPNALVYAGTNCTQIKKSLKSGRLRLVRGSFNEPLKEQEVSPKKAEEVKEKLIQIQEEVQAQEKIEEKELKEAAAPEVQEEVQEEIQEEPVIESEEAKKAEAKKSSRKKSKKVVETEEE